MSFLGNKQVVGWLQALLAVMVFLGLCNVFGRYCIVTYNTNPLIYSCVSFSSAALALLLYAGRGPLGKETMRSIDTWVYGVVLMCGYVFGMLLYAYVTSTEGTILQKISVFMSVMASWIFLGRVPDRYQLIGTSIITIGVFAVCWGLGQENLGTILLLALTYGGLQAARIFTAELHRPHSQAASQKKDPKARARVISFVMFTMSCIFTVFCILLAGVQELQGERISEYLPMFSDFKHPPTIFLGIIMGVLIVVPLRILEFSSAHTIKAENFTTVTAFSSLGTMFWEWATSPISGLSIKAISTYDVMAGVFITTGALVIALTRPMIARRKNALQDYIQVSPQDVQSVTDSRSILVEALEHFDGDLAKTAKALDLPRPAIQAVLDDEEHSLAFKELSAVGRQFRKNVAGADALTGLLNRSHFKRKAKDLLEEGSLLTLLYIDLDKFKPINDTHGHEVGDAVLTVSAERMLAVLPETALVARLGGDEFAVLADKDYSEAVKKEVGQLIQLDSLEEALSVGASIGVAQFPEHGNTLKELLDAADKHMYDDKQAREKAAELPNELSSAN